MNREETETKLQATEARMDARVAVFEARAERLDARIDRMADDIDHLRQGFGELRTEMRETRADVKNMRLWIGGAALTTVLGVAGLNHQLIQGMASAFQSGSTAGGYTAQIGEQLRAINGRLEAIEKRGLEADARVGAHSSESPGTKPER